MELFFNLHYTATNHHDFNCELNYKSHSHLSPWLKYLAIFLELFCPYIILGHSVLQNVYFLCHACSFLKLQLKVEEYHMVTEVDVSKISSYCKHAAFTLLFSTTGKTLYISCRHSAFSPQRQLSFYTFLSLLPFLRRLWYYKAEVSYGSLGSVWNLWVKRSALHFIAMFEIKLANAASCIPAVRTPQGWPLTKISSCSINPPGSTTAAMMV